MKNNTPISYIEISKKNLIHNFNELKKITKPGTEIAVVVKSNAYGHGQNEVAKILEPYADYFQVDSVAELELLRKIITKKTFVLGYVQISEIEKAIKLGCILSVFSLLQLKNIEEIAGKLKIKQEIHIPIDAYLGREGILESEWGEFFKEVKKCKNITLGGIYAHFANIEDTKNFSHAQKQINKYKDALTMARDFGFKKLRTHISATSGLLVYETCLRRQENKGEHHIVRLGIGMYGMWPREYIKDTNNEKLKLKPVMTWKAKIAQIKTLPEGHTVGYGLTYITSQMTKIAVIPVGYADGYDRGLSNIGEVIISGTRCKVLGRIAMNMFVVNVGHLTDVKVEDEVVILGKQGKESASTCKGSPTRGGEITAEEIAKKIDTINYEITTRVSPLLPRIII